MKEISDSLLAHNSQEETSLATCWWVQRKDRLTYGFTDHDRDIFYNGIRYQASSGFTASAVETTAGINVDDLEVEGVLRSPAITEAGMLAGRWDNAEVRVFKINWRNPSAGILKLRRGNLGAIKRSRSTFIAELRGLAQSLQQPIGRTLGPQCDADFGDDRCKIDLSQYLFSDTVASVIEPRIFTVTNTVFSEDLFRFGLVVFVDGPNRGTQMEIRSADGTNRVQLFLPMSYPIQVGDRVFMTYGCGKTFEQCQRYGNVNNFRGFPSVPTTDELVRGPD